MSSTCECILNSVSFSSYNVVFVALISYSNCLLTPEKTCASDVLIRKIVFDFSRSNSLIFITELKFRLPKFNHHAFLLN